MGARDSIAVGVGIVVGGIVLIIAAASSPTRIEGLQIGAGLLIGLLHDAVMARGQDLGVGGVANVSQDRG